MTTATQYFVARMQAEQVHPAAIAAFVDAYQQLVDGATGFIPESTISPVTNLPHLDDMTHLRAHGQTLLA